MNLRNITIWTTGVMMVVATVGAFMFPFVVIGFVDDLIIYPLPPLIWLLTGLPLLISCIIVEKKLKHSISICVLLVSTVIYGILYVLVWYLSFFVDLRYGFLFVVGFPIMIPFWITAYVLDRFYVKQQEPQA